LNLRSTPAGEVTKPDNFSKIMTTPDQVLAAVTATATIAEAIRELKQVPSGVLYSVVMSKMDLATYQRIIAILKDSGLVAEVNHMLAWVEPKPLTESAHNTFPNGIWTQKSATIDDLIADRPPTGPSLYERVKRMLIHGETPEAIAQIFGISVSAVRRVAATMTKP
jgi:hypothetical protein